jgi:hypothetical protein
VTETDQFFNVAENKNFFVIRKNVCARWNLSQISTKSAVEV